MNYAFRFMAGRLETVAKDRAAGEGLISSVRAKLVELAEEAEIDEPSREGDAWAFWLDIGGDRFRIAVTAEASPSEWRLSVEHREPMFVRGHEGHARHQARFDVLVAQLRRIILLPEGARLLAETDD